MRTTGENIERSKEFWRQWGLSRTRAFLCLRFREDMSEVGADVCPFRWRSDIPKDIATAESWRNWGTFCISTAGRTVGTQETRVGGRGPTLKWGRGAESHLPRKDWNPFHSQVNYSHPVSLVTWQVQITSSRAPSIPWDVFVTSLVLNQKQASPEKQENQSRGEKNQGE